MSCAVGWECPVCGHGEAEYEGIREHEGSVFVVLVRELCGWTWREITGPASVRVE